MMSNHAKRSYHESKESGTQSTHSYQAAWMAHWSRRHREASLAQNNLFVNHKSKEGISLPLAKQQPPYLSVPDAATDASNCGSKEFTRVPVAGSANVPDEGVTVVSQFSKEERLENEQPFPMFGLSKTRDKTVLTIKDDLLCGQALGHQFNTMSGLNASPRDLLKPDKMSAWPSSAYETQSREHLGLAGTSRDLVEKNCLHISASFKDEFFAPSSRYSIGQSADRLEKMNGSSNLLTAKGHNMSLPELEPDYNSKSAAFIHQQDNDLLTSKNQLAFFRGDNEYQKSLRNQFASRFFQSRTGPLDLMEAECSTRPFFDMETMRICTTTIDSVEGSKFHRTMKELFFTEKKTDANLSRACKIIRDSTVSTTAQFKGSTNTFTEVPGASRNGGFKRHQQGVKLQPLWSSTDSEEKENTVDLKNDSSRKTNTMVMDALKEDHPFGNEVSLLNKDYVGFPKLAASRAAAGFTSEEGSGRENADIPDSRWNYLALPPAISSATYDKQPSSSKTQSLDAVLLIPDADGQMATNSKSRSTQCVPEPGSRWMKRLKISGSESLLAYGTKTSKMEEAARSAKKLNPLLEKTLKQAMTGSGPLMCNKFKSFKKKHIPFDRNEQLVMKGGGSSSMSESMGKSRDELFSYSWIRRWCCNRPQAQRKREGGGETAFVSCEPHSLKASLNDIQKQQFPSIAAMALMGTAMSGLHPCEFKKRGTSVVWNTG